MSTSEPCKFEGCRISAKGLTGFCFEHVLVAYPCVVEECKNRVAAHSRSRCCADHRREGVRRLRKRVLPWEV